MVCTWFSLRNGISKGKKPTVSPFFFYRLVERIRIEKSLSDFFIDASHELSLFAWNNGKGHKLNGAPYFCAERKPSDKGNGCAIYSRNSDVGAGGYVNGRICGDAAQVCPSSSERRPTTKSESFVSRAWKWMINRSRFAQSLDGGMGSNGPFIHILFQFLSNVRTSADCSTTEHKRNQLHAFAICCFYLSSDLLV